MADTKTSDLATVDALASGDQFPIVDISAGTNKKGLLSQVYTFIAAGIAAIGSGVLKSNGSALSSATIVNADISAAAAIAGSKVTAATTSAAGTMSAADKTKLDNVVAPAAGSVGIGAAGAGSVFSSLVAEAIDVTHARTHQTVATAPTIDCDESVVQKLTSALNPSANAAVDVPDNSVTTLHIRVAARQGTTTGCGWVGTMTALRVGSTLTTISAASVEKLGSASWTVSITTTTTGFQVSVNATGVSVAWTIQISTVTNKA